MVSLSQIRALIIEVISDEYGDEVTVREQGKRIVVSPRHTVAGSEDNIVILVSPGRERAS